MLLIIINICITILQLRQLLTICSRSECSGLAQYVSTNYPKERKGWLFNFGTNEGRDLGGYNREEQSGWLSGEFKGKALMACFSRDLELLSGIHINNIFKRGFCKPRMWAPESLDHYSVTAKCDSAGYTPSFERPC